MKLVESSFDSTGSFDGHMRNIRWLPQAKALLDFALRRGPGAWHTLWTLFQIGDMEVERGSQERALTVFRQGRELAGAIAAADPGNAGWQRDLSVSHTKIGDVLADQGNLPAALDAFKASLAIRQRLATSDPGNAGWQRDLSVSHDGIGRLLEKNGRLDKAIVHYRKDLEIAERLAALDPMNAGWQRDVEISRARMARLAGGGASADGSDTRSAPPVTDPAQPATDTPSPPADPPPAPGGGRSWLRRLLRRP